ncbi:hypothetical protein L6452_18853 [Arctium lappa]|uniref:Uncharacterized protein n=1 Tax=Arctium lappa TaxID=4217 RepID=A0ACB9C7D5_ARCLA|nr:hypothetical protein L6452_18853 [Arctium lappa]
MFIEGDTIATHALWRIVKDSMQLSIPVNEFQLYEKARRLKACYLKRSSNSNFSMIDKEYNVYEVSDKIRGKDGNAKLKSEPKDDEKKLILLDHPHAKKVKIHNVKRVKKDNKKEPTILEQSHIKENKERKRALGMKNVKNTVDVDMEYKRKYDKFMTEVTKMKDNDFPVDLAIELVPVSKTLNLEKKWKYIRVLWAETYKKKTRLILETLEKVPSPSHSN